jgi:hypothetical protein
MYKEKVKMVYGVMIYKYKHFPKFIQDQYKYLFQVLNLLELFIKKINKIFNH